MVRPGNSRPAALTQRQVDALASGQPGQAAALLRVPRNEATETRSRTKGSAPVALAPKEMKAISRSGAPDAVLKRIAGAKTVAKKKSKAVHTGRYEGRAPKLGPPSEK